MKLLALLSIIPSTVINADSWEYANLVPSPSPSLRETRPSSAPSISDTKTPPSEEDSHEEKSQKPTIHSWEYTTETQMPSVSKKNDSSQVERSNKPSLRKTKPPTISSVTPSLREGSSAPSKEGTSTDQPTVETSDGVLNQNSVLSDRKKPNILIILADDVGTGDIPSYWNSGMVDMPNIHRLAESGVTFLNAHATPLCAPSRYMLLSGNYQHRGRNANGSWNLGYENNQFRSHQKSIAEVLKRAGYETLMAGKWHLGAKVPPSGLINRDKYLTDPGHDWSMSLIDGPSAIGFDHSLITTGGIQEAPYSFFRNGFLTTNVTSDAHYWKAGSYQTPIGESIILKPGEGDMAWDSSSYNMKLVNETSDFIDRHLKGRENDPFFAYVALGSVHIPHSPPNHYLNGDPIANQYPTSHLDMLLEMDHVVGSLVSMIEERNLSNDTIIIFTSDNGGLARDKSVPHYPSGPLKGQKGQIWEGGHRIPLMMRFDGIFPSRERRDNLVGLNDVYATLCDLLGIKIPALSAQDSVSFADHIISANNTDRLRDNLGVFDYKNSMLQAESLLKGNLKLIRFFEEFSSVPSHIELYDLAHDISESKDLSHGPEFASIIDQMLLELKALGPCPDEVQGFFPLQYEMLSFNVTCRFFEKKPWKCDKYIEGELNCMATCGTRHKKTCQPEIYAK